MPKTVSEFEGILNSETLTTTFPTHLVYLSDDIKTNISSLEKTTDANAYFWRQSLDPNREAEPAVWAISYRVIYRANVIINNIMDAEGGNEQKKKEILAEALVTRADAYYNLLTVFAKAYDRNTAVSDPGLPWVTSTDVTTATPDRLSLQETLDRMIEDLKVAANDLPTTNVNKYRATKYVANGLLARIYLYMEDYANAATYATKALEAPHIISNYNDIYSFYELPMVEDDPEILWARLTEDAYLINDLNYSQSLVDIFDYSDLRFLYFAEDWYGEGDYIRNSFGFVNTGITFPEMLLTKAEALAHNDDFSTAMDIVNTLRENRIDQYSYEELVASSKEEAIDLILLERRKELAFGGQRWADMKRLDKQGRMPEVERINKDGDVLASLPPKSPNYTIEIPGRVLLFNPNMKKNH